MSLSDVSKRDPSMVGTSGYERAALDFYPTPRSAFDGLIQALGDDFPAMLAWEPFAGNGAIATPLTEFTRGVVSTDITAYDGFEVFENAYIQWVLDQQDGKATIAQMPRRMADIEKLKGFRPDLIVSNPPYGKDAERAARHALKLMEPERGMVAFLCRHEWDAARSRSDLFDHPAFSAKITLRHRPRWIAGSKGAPRFPYAWFVWDWTKPAGAKPELIYVR